MRDGPCSKKLPYGVGSKRIQRRAGRWDCTQLTGKIQASKTVRSHIRVSGHMTHDFQYQRAPEPAPSRLALRQEEKLFSLSCKVQSSSKRGSPEAHARPYRHFLNLLVSPGRSSLAMSKYFEVEEQRPFPEGKLVVGQSPRKSMESKGGHGL